MIKVDRKVKNNFRKLYCVYLNYTIRYRVATQSGVQEKLGKTKKNDKSQVKMGFMKKFKNVFLTIEFVSSTLPNSLYLKAFEQ